MAKNQENIAGENMNIDLQNPEKKASQKPAAAPPKKAEPKGGYWWGTGRRKSSVARVRIRPGKGKLIVNKKKLSDFFDREQDRNSVLAPLIDVECRDKFDVFVNVKGGGTTGQSVQPDWALQGLLEIMMKITFRPCYGGHLTRDSRMVERKKPGQKSARRKFQFSKR